MKLPAITPHDARDIGLKLVRPLGAARRPLEAAAQRRDLYDSNGIIMMLPGIAALVDLRLSA